MFLLLSAGHGLAATWLEGQTYLTSDLENRNDLIEFSGEGGLSDADFGSPESNSALLDVVDNRWSEQGDQRNVGDHLVSGHFGESSAYAVGALRYGLFLDKQWLISAGFGMGQIRLNDKNDISNSKVRSTAFALRNQWWWSAQSPLSVFAELNYVSSRLDATCKTSVTDTNDTLNICEEGRGFSRGVSFASGIDLHWSFRSEVYWGIAWTIVGVRRSLYQKFDFKGGVIDETSPRIEKYLKGPMFFGLNNIGMFVVLN